VPPASTAAWQQSLLNPENNEHPGGGLPGDARHDDLLDLVQRAVRGSELASRTAHRVGGLWASSFGAASLVAASEVLRLLSERREDLVAERTRALKAASTGSCGTSSPAGLPGRSRPIEPR
jgi:hypothetical protein